MDATEEKWPITSIHIKKNIFAVTKLMENEDWL